MRFYLIFICLFFIPFIYGQAEHVEASHSAYKFLERMENRNLISGYNSFELPKSRYDIAGYLKQIKENVKKLSQLDQKILADLEVEFQHELSGNTFDSRGIINGNGYNFFSEGQKYLYYLSEDKFNLFINLYAEFGYQYVNRKNIINNNASFGSIGGIIRGTALDHIGFYLKGTNGLVSGNRQAALINKRFAQNFKFTEKTDEDFFDDTEGYLTADFDLIKFKIGREHFQLGYGPIAIIDNNSPLFDQLGFNLNYKFFSYSYVHARLLESRWNLQSYSDKFLVYHRLGLNISRHFDFGAGEFVLYGRRGLDLSYLNPFAFYKSVEHSNHDRDNSMLFVDINNNSFDRTKLHLELLIDDISYGKIGTEWYGNQIMINAGILSTDIFDLPADININYRRTDPYTFTHRFPQNNFTNLDYNLSTFTLPNSELFQVSFNYRFNYRLEISTGINYIIHGANLEADGRIINYGGDINLGHRETDSENVSFLDGVKEYFRKIDLGINYEVINQMILRLNLSYFNNSTKEIQSHKEIQSFITLTTVF